MVITIFGESCVGKSTIADALNKNIGGEIFSDKDYLRLAKSESMAKAQFQKLLKNAEENHIIYVISELEHLSLLPDTALRVLVTAELDVILERFAARMRGTLPPPVKAMLEKKHGCFDSQPHDLKIESGKTDTEIAVSQIMRLLFPKS